MRHDSPLHLSRASARAAIAEQLTAMSAALEPDRVAILQRRDASALAEADAWDALVATSPGLRPPLFGLGLAVKACFDVAGWRTTAGSIVLNDEPVATSDAPAVARLRCAGAIVTSQTNMTEFAFGALGQNPHYGTPRTPLDPTRERIAGGSTSGGAVSVALGFADVALGSDTSGSARIPAAFCGTVGFKPTQGRYPDEGIVPLSPSFDVPGLLARDAETIRLLDRVMTGATSTPDPIPDHLRGRRFLVPADFALDQTEPEVVVAFENALLRLADRGAEIVRRDWPVLARYGEISVAGGIIVAESYAWHRPFVDAHPERYDPRVGPRILLGREVKAEAYISALRRLAELARDYEREMSAFDALLTPTVPFTPPRVADLDDDEVYYPTNRLSFRLTEIANRINVPSISLPVSPGRPIGLLLTGRHARDEQLLDLSVAIQSALRTSE